MTILTVTTDSVSPGPEEAPTGGANAVRLTVADIRWGIAAGARPA